MVDNSGQTLLLSQLTDRADDVAGRTLSHRHFRYLSRLLSHYFGERLEIELAVDRYNTDDESTTGRCDQSLEYALGLDARLPGCLEPKRFMRRIVLVLVHRESDTRVAGNNPPMLAWAAYVTSPTLAPPLM